MTVFFLRDLEAVFFWLLTASWQASVLAVVVLLIQRILGARLNPRWRYALWLLVVLRLVMPALPESAWSLFQFTPTPPAALTVPISEPLFVSAPSLPSPAVHADVSEPVRPLTLYSLLAVIWLAGAVGLLILTWMVNRRFAVQVANSPAIADAELLCLFDEVKAELSIHRYIRLVENGQVQSPAIMGLFTPTLLLPANVRERFDATELRLIFLHELAHLKRGDVIVQALIALLQVLHWFNPVLWFAFRRMRIDREPATDALVLSRTGESEKERYGLMLIKLLEHFNQRHSLPTLVGILEDKDQFKRRFSLIAKFTRGAYGWSLLSVVLIAILGVVCLTKAKPPSTVEAKSPAASVYVQSVVAMIPEEDCQKHQAEFDSAVKRGDFKALEQLGLLRVIGRPGVYSRTGELIVVTAGDLDVTKADYLMRINLTVTRDGDYFRNTGEFWLTSVDDPTQEEIKEMIDKGKTEMAPHVTSRSVNIFQEMTAGQTRVVEMPEIPARVFRNAFPGESAPSGPQRLLLFLTTEATAVAPLQAKSSAPPAQSPKREHTVYGRLFGQNPSPIDFTKSSGKWFEPDQVKGHEYPFTFNADGSFVVSNINSGTYYGWAHLVPKVGSGSTTPLKPIDITLAPLTVDASSEKTTHNENVSVNFEAPKGLIEIELKTVEIDDDVYLANKEKIDAAIEKDDVVAAITLMNGLKGVSILSLPSVSTQPGTKANIEVVREFPYPTGYQNGKTATLPTPSATPPTPSEFVTKDVGVSAEITPSIDGGNSPTHGKIILSGKFVTTNFEGFTKSNYVKMGMASFSTSESLFIEALDNKQTKGVWVPGEHVGMQNPVDPNWEAKGPTVKKRLLLFISAERVK